MNGILDQTEKFGIENTRVSGTLKALFNQYQFNLVKKMKENCFSFVSLERKMKQGLNSFDSTI